MNFIVLMKSGRGNGPVKPGNLRNARCQIRRFDREIRLSLQLTVVRELFLEVMVYVKTFFYIGVRNRRTSR